MNKKLLAMAVSAAMFAPVAAQADVSVYGRIQAEYSVEDLDCNGCDSVQSIDDDANQSRIGFKFDEKLGDGLTAFGKMEFHVNPSEGGNTSSASTAASTNSALGNRDAHVGLKGSWGSIAAGSFHAPYKTAGGVKWDPFNATHLQSRRAGGMSGGTGIGGTNGFMRNTIYYNSPKVNGFEAQFAISPDETNSGAENGVDGDNDYSVALHYKNGPWHAIFAHNRNNNPSTVAAGDETLSKVGLQWKSGPWTLAGQYEVIKDADASSIGSKGTSNGAPGTVTGTGANDTYAPAVGADADILWLNVQYKAGNNIFVASYGNTDQDGIVANNDPEYDMWTVGVIHKFSKKTRIFGGFSQTDGDDEGNPNDRDVWSVGIRQDF
jgi:predicted porin